MPETRTSAWRAGLAVLGGVAIALGLPYLTLAHGGGLPVTARLVVIVLALAAGGSLVRVGQSAADADVIRRTHQRRLT